MSAEINGVQVEAIREGAKKAYEDVTGHPLTKRDILEEFPSPGTDRMYPSLPEGDKGLEVRLLNNKGEVVTDARDAVAVLVMSPARHPGLYYKQS